MGEGILLIPNTLSGFFARRRCLMNPWKASRLACKVSTTFSTELIRPKMTNRPNFGTNWNRGKLRKKRKGKHCHGRESKKSFPDEGKAKPQIVIFNLCLKQSGGWMFGNGARQKPLGSSSPTSSSSSSSTFRSHVVAMAIAREPTRHRLPKTRPPQMRPGSSFAVV